MTTLAAPVMFPGWPPMAGPPVPPGQPPTAAATAVPTPTPGTPPTPATTPSTSDIPQDASTQPQVLQNYKYMYVYSILFPSKSPFDPRNFFLKKCDMRLLNPFF